MKKSQYNQHKRRQADANKAAKVYVGRFKILNLIARGIRINTPPTGINAVAYGIRRAIIGA